MSKGKSNEVVCDKGKNETDCQTNNESINRSSNKIFGPGISFFQYLLLKIQYRTCKYDYCNYITNDWQGKSSY